MGKCVSLSAKSLTGLFHDISTEHVVHFLSFLHLYNTGPIRERRASWPPGIQWPSQFAIS